MRVQPAAKPLARPARLLGVAGARRTHGLPRREADATFFEARIFQRSLRGSGQRMVNVNINHLVTEGMRSFDGYGGGTEDAHHV